MIIFLSPSNTDYHPREVMVHYGNKYSPSSLICVIDEPHKHTNHKVSPGGKVQLVIRDCILKSSSL